MLWRAKEVDVVFDGDSLIKEEFEKLVKQFNIQTIIETGTYLGDTTIELSKMVPYVYTVEANEENFDISQAKLSNYGNVDCLFGKSQNVLKELLQNCPVTKPLFFYLDAHWEDYNPLLDELIIISQHAKDSVIVIHDFMVPNHPEFGFDYYPIIQNGIKVGYYPLSLQLIQGHLSKCYTKGYEYYYNESANCENKRGIIYILPRVK